MVDFNEIIALAMEEGKSIEEIAHEMSNALNEASKPKTTPREAYLKELRKRVESEDPDMFNHIAALTLCVAEKHDDWSLTGIKTFINSISEQVVLAEGAIDCIEHGGGDIMKALTDVLRNKSKDEGGRQPHRSGIEAFFKSLGI